LPKAKDIHPLNRTVSGDSLYSGRSKASNKTTTRSKSRGRKDKPDPIKRNKSEGDLDFNLNDDSHSDLASFWAMDDFTTSPDNGIKGMEKSEPRRKLKGTTMTATTTAVTGSTLVSNKKEETKEDEVITPKVKTPDAWDLLGPPSESKLYEKSTIAEAPEPTTPQPSRPKRDSKRRRSSLDCLDLSKTDIKPMSQMELRAFLHLKPPSLKNVCDGSVACSVSTYDGSCASLLQGNYRELRPKLPSIFLDAATYYNDMLKPSRILKKTRSKKGKK
jgi:hypothetical protein